MNDLNVFSRCGLESVELNTFLTTQISYRKGRKIKVQKMQVGISKDRCPTLKVHVVDIQEATEVTYFGDILSCDGKNTKNIKSKISKGMGIITNIFNFLKAVCFGQH